MKAIQSMIALAAIAIGMSVPVSAATTDPEVIIYRFPGVRDDGNADNTGIATVFSCTNFSGVQETLRFVTRSAIGTLLTNVPLQAVHLQDLNDGYASSCRLPELQPGHRSGGRDDRDCRDIDEHHLYGNGFGRCQLET